MEIKEVKELMSQFNDSSLTEFDLREGSFELYMNKIKQVAKFQRLYKKKSSQQRPSLPLLTRQLLNLQHQKVPQLLKAKAADKLSLPPL